MNNVEPTESQLRHYSLLDDAWRRLSDNPDDLVSRDFIIKSYTPLVEGTARKHIKKKPWPFEYEDLKQAGMLGLLQAINKFNPEFGTKFSTFATLRVNGAIIDEINSMDWTPRKIRSAIKQVMNAQEKMRKENPGKNPTPEELVVETGLSIEDVYLALKGEPKTHVTAIDQEAIHSIESGGGRNSFVSIHGAHDQGIDKIVESGALKDIIVDALVHNCTPQEADIIIRHFYKHETLKSISESLSLSSSKISTMKNSGLAKLQAVINADDWYYGD